MSSLKRRLAAIVFTDIVGFTDLSSKDEEGAKLYFETGKINTGDRFYSIKYILAPAFLLFFTFSFGIMLSFII